MEEEIRALRQKCQQLDLELKNIKEELQMLRENIKKELEADPFEHIPLPIPPGLEQF